MAVHRGPGPRTYRRIDTANGSATVSMRVEDDSVVLSARWGTSVTDSSWLRCSHADCFGSSAFSDQHCFRHSANEPGGLLAGNVDAVIDFRGMEVTEEIWREAEGYFTERRVLMCTGALFAFPVMLNGRALREINLAGASFEQGLELRDCEAAVLDISYADFRNRGLAMHGCRISRVDARCAHADDSIFVTDCTVAGDALFDGATPDLRFDGSKIKSLSLRDASVENVSLSNVEVLNDLNVGG